MRQKHISITDEQFKFVDDTFFKLSGFVQKKLQEHIEEIKNEQEYHTDCTVTCGT
ncbi:MAG: hypothetical protein KAJ93_01805 [Methanosarcinales archaeon]|nr:hypothetical protein [Methanosarcinales archaeon]